MIKIFHQKTEQMELLVSELERIWKKQAWGNYQDC